jgi:predicted GIY-YIG superfamily endonuclease
MTDNLIQRVWMHKNEVVRGFTKQYGVKILVWYEQHESREAALTRERQMKKWDRAWKLQAIEQMNPLGLTFTKAFLFSKDWVPAFAGTNGR